MTSLNYYGSLRLLRLKKAAKQLKEATRCTHAQALDQIAKNNGFPTWTALLRDAKEKGEAK